MVTKFLAEPWCRNRVHPRLGGTGGKNQALQEVKGSHSTKTSEASRLVLVVAQGSKLRICLSKTCDIPFWPQNIVPLHGGSPVSTAKVELPCLTSRSAVD